MSQASSRSGFAQVGLAVLIAGAAVPAAAAEGRRASLDFLDLETPSRSQLRAPSGFVPLTPDVQIRPAVPSASGVLQCVPYARRISGIQIYGDAHTWWESAEGRYNRGWKPRIGAVLAFQATDVMPLGHVASVNKILSRREILLDHANWSGPGVIDKQALAVDVSPANDWSQVRIWFGPTNKLGVRVNPAYGFIYPEAPKFDRPAIRFASMDGEVREKSAKREKRRDRRAERAPQLAYAALAIDDLDERVTVSTARAMRLASRR